MPDFLEWLDAHQDSIEITSLGKTRVGKTWNFKRRVLPDEFLVYYVLQNRAVIKVEGKSRILEPNHCLWLNPGVLHSLTNFDLNKLFYVYHMRFRVRAKVLHTPFAEPFQLVKGVSDLSVLFSFLCEYHRINIPGAPQICRYFLRALCAIFHQQRPPTRPDHDPLRQTAAAHSGLRGRTDREKSPGSRHIAPLLGYSHDYFRPALQAKLTACR